jgi:biopolymer transport protein ExbD
MKRWSRTISLEKGVQPMKVNLGTQKRARIEILPLIDIVFLLLVFFIYAMLSMAVHRGVPVSLPASSSAQIERRLTLSVTIRQSGDIVLERDRVALRDLGSLLHAKAMMSEDLGVLLFADREVSCQVLVKVLDQIRSAGVTRVSLQTTKEAAQP